MEDPVSQNRQEPIQDKHGNLIFSPKKLFGGKGRPEAFFPRRSVRKAPIDADVYWPRIAVPRLSARFPIFFKVVSRARNSFGLASAKTFLISAACFRKIGPINSLPLGVSDTIRTRRSSELSTRLTRPLSCRRSMATLIEPGVRYTFGPIVFTGKGPLLRSASSIRKSVSSIPVSSSPA